MMIRSCLIRILAFHNFLPKVPCTLSSVPSSVLPQPCEWTNGFILSRQKWLTLWMLWYQHLEGGGLGVFVNFSVACLWLVCNSIRRLSPTPVNKCVYSLHLSHRISISSQEKQSLMWSEKTSPSTVSAIRKRKPRQTSPRWLCGCSVYPQLAIVPSYRRSENPNESLFTFPLAPLS